jgi:hypothetical protein
VGDKDLNLMQSLASRLRNNPTFMAHSLCIYQQHKGIDEEDIARELGTIPEMVLRLALCRKPQNNSHTFEEQIAQLSDFTLIDGAKLKEMIRVSELAEATSWRQSLYSPLAHLVLGEPSAKLLTGMAERLGKNPDFMGETLCLYKQQEDLDDEQLAKNLGTSQAMLLLLAICKRPDSTVKNFNAQVQRLADYTGIEAHKLSGMIQQVAALRELTRAEVAPTKSFAVFLQSAIRGLRAGVSRGPLVANVCLSVLMMIGILWWLEGKNNFQEGTSNTLQAVKPSESADRTKTEPDSHKPSVESATRPLKSTNETVPHNVSKARTYIARRIEREAGLLATVTVDLDQYKMMRDEPRNREDKKIIKLPQSRTRISLKLSEGLAKGTYRVSIIDAFNKSLVSTTARSTNGKTLQVILDMTHLEATTYRLCITRKGEAPNFYSVVIEKT